MNAETYNRMIEKIKSGYTLNIATSSRITTISPNTLTKWEKSGNAIMKNATTEDGFYIASGKHFDYVIPACSKIYFTF